MRGFVQPFAVFVQRGRGQHADTAREHGGLVAQNVAKDVARGNHVKLFGRAHQLHGGVVHIHVREFYIGVLFAHFVKDFAPQFGGFQHVGFAYGADFFVAILGSLKSNVGDAADFAFAVPHGVEAFALAVFQRADAARLAEIDVAGEFAHNQNVQPGHNFGFERGGVGQLFIQNGGAQVGKQIQICADGQEAALGAQRAVKLVVLGRTDCAEQHGIGGTAEVLRELGIGAAELVVGFAAQGGVFVGYVQALFNQFIEHAHGFVHDFGADAVAFEDS